MAPKLNDQDIISELRKGNNSVFQELYAHFPMIQSMVLKNNGTKEDAKDLFQNALIIFYKKAIDKNFQLTSRISSYLYSVCDKNWKKKITRDKNMFQSDVTELNHLGSDDEPKVEVHKGKALKDYIDDLLDRIGEPCKTILIMHEYQKLSMKIITEKMGYANEHTTRQQKYKCLLKLKKMVPATIAQEYLT